MKYRPQGQAWAEAKYPSGTTGSPNVLHFPRIRTYYRIYRFSFTTTVHGNSSVIHSWTCEEVSTTMRVSSSHASWRDALEYASLLEKRARRTAA